MAKTKFLLGIFLILFILTSCTNKHSFVVEGNITNLVDSNLYFVNTSGSMIKIDTIQVGDDGAFKYQGASDSIFPILVYMEKGSVWITVWAKNGERIQINGDAVYPELIEVTGNEISNLLVEFKTNNKDVIKERQDLIDAKNPDNQAEISRLDLILREKAEEFIAAYPSSVASLVLIQDYLVDSSKDWETLDRYLSLIEGDAVTNKLYGKLKAVIENYRRTAIGNKAPDFSLISTKRDTLSLETFKDKYLVLTFDSPEYVKGKRDYTALTEIKKKFPKEKVEILTVSLEENPTKWDSIARHEKIDWYQVIDSRGLASEVYLAYNISELPGHILLDKEGLIVARDISTDSIKTVLNDLINKKQ